MAKIKVLEQDITTVKVNDEDYISLTNIAKYKNETEANEIIRNWLRNRNTIEFLGIWEKINNPSFKTVEFDGFVLASITFMRKYIQDIMSLLLLVLIRNYSMRFFLRWSEVFKSRDTNYGEFATITLKAVRRENNV